MVTFALGPWEPLGRDGSICRRDANGRMGAAVWSPGVDGWGWFAIAPNGDGRGDRETDKRRAQELADAAVIEIGGNAL